MTMPSYSSLKVHVVGRAPSMVLVLFVLLSVFFGLSWPAAATECTDPPSGAVFSFGGRVISSTGQVVVCENGSWVPFLKYNASGDITGIGNNTCTTGQVLKFDGTKFACADGGSSGGVDADVLTYSNPDDVQVFDVSGTWTKPEGAKFVLIEAIGGGGAGTYIWSDGSLQSRHGGGGGGFDRRLMAATDLGATESVVVGTGQPRGYTAGKGGDSLFGTHVLALGGYGGGYQYDSPLAPPCVPGGGCPGVTGAGRAPYTNFPGGDSVYGGGGGGSFGSAGGISKFGGNGGANGVAGTAPGGGGGFNAAGANGRVTVKTWLE